MQCIGVVRLDFQRPAQRLFGAGPVIMMNHLVPASRSQDFRDIRVKLKGAVHRGDGFLLDHIEIEVLVVLRQDHIGVGKPGVAERKIGVEFDHFLKILHRRH